MRLNIFLIFLLKIKAKTHITAVINIIIKCLILNVNYTNSKEVILI